MINNLQNTIKFSSDKLISTLKKTLVNETSFNLHNRSDGISLLDKLLPTSVPTYKMDVFERKQEQKIQKPKIISSPI